MPGTSDHSRLENLREALRRANSVCEFALRMTRDSDSKSVPPGLVADFMEARSQVERAFIPVHDELSGELRKRIKELILRTRGLNAEAMAEGKEKLAKAVRGALNHLMIDGGMPLSLTEEIFESTEAVPSAQSKDKPQSAHVRGLTTTAPLYASKGERPAAKTVMSRGMGSVLVLLLACAGLVAAYGLGVFSDGGPASNASNTFVGKTDQGPQENQPANAPRDGGSSSEAFDKVAAGYTRTLQPQQLMPYLNPLDQELDLATLRASELPTLMLGLERIVYQLEAERVRLEPDETRRRLQRFAESAVRGEPKWIGARKPFLDGLVDHVKSELQLALFSDGEQVLLSDVFSAKGGARMPLIVALCALARACGADVAIVTPMGVEFPLLAQQLRAGTATYDGEQQGLRPTRAQETALAQVLTALCERLRPTMQTAHGRAAVSAIILRCQGNLDIRQAREALADLEVQWFSALDKPEEPYHSRRLIMQPAAKLLQPAICNALLSADARGDATEAAKLLDLASAAGDKAATDRALLLLAQRAEKGAKYKGEPLSYAVAQMLKRRGEPTSAAAWFKRALEEDPDFWPPAYQLAELSPDPGLKRTYFSMAYARGYRAPEFLRDLAKRQAEAGDSLSALALLDDLCALSECTPQDVANAALICLSLGKPQWAQQRIANSKFKLEPPLLRVDLIAELSQNGLSERARELAKAYGKRGTDDPYIESLLQRFGG